MRIFAIAIALVSLSAQAIYRPGWERPIAQASLEQISSQTIGLRAERLVMNKLDGARKPVSFTLTEDTGIRCIQAPCPSSKTTMFEIVKIQKQANGAVVYSALERRHLHPNIIGPMKRSLTVVARNGNWEVTLRHFGTVGEYRGVVEPVYTIQ